jgi:hypothetical protein
LLAEELLPHFDTDSYCDRLGSVASHSYSIELLCREQERSAEVVLEHLMPIDPKISAYCRSFAVAAGGSYDVMLACLRAEEVAARSVLSLPVDPGVRARCSEIAEVAGGSSVILFDCIEQAAEAAASR